MLGTFFIQILIGPSSPLSHFHFHDDKKIGVTMGVKHDENVIFFLKKETGGAHTLTKFKKQIYLLNNPNLKKKKKTGYIYGGR